MQQHSSSDTIIGRVWFGCNSMGVVRLHRVAGCVYAVTNLHELVQVYKASRRDRAAPATRWVDSLRAGLAQRPLVHVENGGRFGTAWAIVPLPDTLPAVPMDESSTMQLFDVSTHVKHDSVFVNSIA